MRFEAMQGQLTDNMRAFFCRYKPQYYTFELVEVVAKLLITGATRFV